MFHRLLKLPVNKSFFLFGARGTGKSTLLRIRFPTDTATTVNLLDPEVERGLALEPERLQRIVSSLPASTTHLIIDEIQKLPSLLDVVHLLIESPGRKVSFILTGSSARKLKQGGGNLLAGRAVIRNLFPLLEPEIGSSFDLDSVLRWGTLPRIVNAAPDERDDELRAYATTYLKEEIFAEQLVRKLEPFRRFLQVAAQMNGKIINFAKVARDVGVDAKTVQSYYILLEDTLVGFFLDSWHASVRKRLRQAPKFYFFDPGVARALAGHLRVLPQRGTSYYGELFEQQVLRELVHGNTMLQRDLSFGYLLTSRGVEVDLVARRPDGSVALVEFKSTTRVSDDDFRSLRLFESDFPDADFFLLSCDPRPQTSGKIKAMPWNEGIALLLGS